MLHVPVERGGHADEAHGLSGRRGIEDNHVVTLLAPVLIDVHHRAELFHAGEDRKFLGLHAADAGSAQYRSYVGRDFLPMTLDLFLDIELLDPEPITHL